METNSLDFVKSLELLGLRNFTACELILCTILEGKKYRKKSFFFLISNFRRVLNVVFFLLSDSPASEIYMPTFLNTFFSLFIGDVSRKNNRDGLVVVFIR